MATFNMGNVQAIMTQTSVAITTPFGAFTVAAGVPFTTNLQTLDIPVGTVVAVMDSVHSPKGKHLQVFSIDRIITVAAAAEEGDTSGPSSIESNSTSAPKQYAKGKRPNGIRAASHIGTSK